MAVDELSEYVKRYTTLRRAVKALKSKKFALPNPSTWDDLNDQEFVKLYQQYIGARSVYAMCCTMSPERYHHWRIFTDKDDADGVCIVLKRAPLEEALNRITGVRAERVDYVPINDMRGARRRPPENLPFIKRSGYRDEREWRILLTSPECQRAVFEIPFNVEWVHRIILNPWMAKTEREKARESLRPLIQKPARVTATFLTNSTEWKNLGKRLVTERS
jgi:hypothetical protein